MSTFSASSSSPSGGSGSMTVSGSNSGISSLTLTPERAQYPEGYLNPRSPRSFGPPSLLLPAATSSVSATITSSSANGTHSPLYRNINSNPIQEQRHIASAIQARGLLVEEEGGYLVPMRDVLRGPSALNGTPDFSQRNPPQRLPRSPLRSDSSSVDGYSGRLSTASSVEPLLSQYSQPTHRSK